METRTHTPAIRRDTLKSEQLFRLDRNTLGPFEGARKGGRRPHIAAISSYNAAALWLERANWTIRRWRASRSCRILCRHLPRSMGQQFVRGRYMSGMQEDLSMIHR